MAQLPTEGPVRPISAMAERDGDPLEMLAQQINDRFALGREARLALEQRLAALEGRAVTRALTMSGTTTTGLVFNPPFAAPPLVLPVLSVAGGQWIAGSVGAVTAKGAAVTAVKRTRAAATLSVTLNTAQAPASVEDAPAGTAAAFVAIGR